MNPPPRVPPELRHPRHWPAWAGVYLLWLATLLPAGLQLALGRAIGAALHLLARRRRHITETNLRLCFPELSAQARAALVRQTFADNGTGLIETAIAWFTPPEQLRGRVEFEGLEHLQAAKDRGKGVLLIGAHYTTLDLCGNLFTLFSPASVMYRAQNNPVFEHIMTRPPAHVRAGIDRSDMRSAIRCLKSGGVLWYAPDQDYGRKHSVFAPFFGVPAASIVATSRILRMTGATPVLFSHWRRDDGSGYVLRVEPIPEPLPSGSDEEDARVVNAHIEACIRRHPSQYMWVHRRFKTRPPGEARPY